MKKTRLLVVLIKMIIPNMLSINTHDDLSCDICYKNGDSINVFNCKIAEFEQAAANQKGKKFSGIMDQLIINA